jgi:hypothetical protein
MPMASSNKPDPTHLHEGCIQPTGCQKCQVQKSRIWAANHTWTQDGSDLPAQRSCMVDRNRVITTTLNTFRRKTRPILVARWMLVVLCSTGHAWKPLTMAIPVIIIDELSLSSTVFEARFGEQVPPTHVRAVELLSDP